MARRVSSSTLSSPMAVLLVLCAIASSLVSSSPSGHGADADPVASVLDFVPGAVRLHPNQAVVTAPINVSLPTGNEQPSVSVWVRHLPRDTKGDDVRASVTSSGTGGDVNRHAAWGCFVGQTVVMSVPTWQVECLENRSNSGAGDADGNCSKSALEQHRTRLSDEIAASRKRVDDIDDDVRRVTARGKLRDTAVSAYLTGITGSGNNRRPQPVGAAQDDGAPKMALPSLGTLLSDLDAVDTFWDATSAKLRELREAADAARKELVELESAKSATYQLTAVAKVDVVCPAALSSDIGEGAAVPVDVTITTSSASWAPTYDVRIDSGSDAHELDFRADVRQWTGIDWDDVEVTVTTAEVVEDGDATLPPLPRLIVRPRAEVEAAERRQKAMQQAFERLNSVRHSLKRKVKKAAPYSGSRGRRMKAQALADVDEEAEEMMAFGGSMEMDAGAAPTGAAVPGGAEDDDDDSNDIKEEGEIHVAEEVVTGARQPPSFTSAQRMAGSVFTATLSRRASIPSSSDATGTTLPVALEHTLSGTIKLVAHPDVSTNVYQRANLTNADARGGTLLAGRARIYVDGSFTTSGRLPTLAEGGSVQLDLGRCTGLAVERQLRADESKQEGGIFWSETTRSHAQRYRVTVRNTGYAIAKTGQQEAPVVHVTVAVPRSTQQDVEVRTPGSEVPQPACSALDEHIESCMRRSDSDRDSCLYVVDQKHLERERCETGRSEAKRSRFVRSIKDSVLETVLAVPPPAEVAAAGSGLGSASNGSDRSSGDYAIVMGGPKKLGDLVTVPE